LCPAEYADVCADLEDIDKLVIGVEELETAGGLNPLNLLNPLNHSTVNFTFDGPAVKLIFAD